MNALNTVLLAIAITLLSANLMLNSLDHADLKETFQEGKSYFEGRLNEKEWPRECP